MFKIPQVSFRETSADQQAYDKSNEVSSEDPFWCSDIVTIYLSSSEVLKVLSPSVMMDIFH